MTNHFSTVPIGRALRAAGHASPKRVRPLALVVEDEPILRNTLSAILSGSGLSALTARDGPEGLETARLIPPEVLISDLTIPGINGFDLALAVTRATPDCDVILFASFASAADLNADMRAAGRSFTVLLKPVHPADLLDAVFALLSRRGLPLNPPTTFPSSGLYDLLSSARVESELFPASCHVSLRHRLRERTPVA